jgi:SAM-dependent methyltransferase
MNSKENTAAHGIGEEFEIYTRRFSEGENSTRSVTWQVLCREFLQPYVKQDGIIVDIGAGDGHFLLNIQARTKIAVDLSPHTKVLEAQGVKVLLIPATEMSLHLSEKVDLIFMSNFLEHLPDKRTLLEVFKECKKVLKPGGTLMILQPNIRYAGAAYWDYIDHHIALTEHSLQEALNISGYDVKKMIPRFLPYTVRSGVGRLAEGKMTKFLVSMYLKIPLLWRIFGKQTFIVATSRAES